MISMVKQIDHILTRNLSNQLNARMSSQIPTSLLTVVMEKGNYQTLPATTPNVPIQQKTS